MALDYFLGVFNICTDFLVFVIPTIIIMNVQTTNQKKSIVIAAFATRPMYVGLLLCTVLSNPLPVQLQQTSSSFIL